MCLFAAVLSHSEQTLGQKEESTKGEKAKHTLPDKYPFLHFAKYQTRDV